MYARASTAVSLMAVAVRNMSATVFFPRRRPKREMRRVFTFAGLPPTTKIKAESTSKKLTPEDLRATLLDFGKTAKFLRERRPGLHDQLVDTAHRVFKTLHLPGNRTGNFEEYEH